MDLDVLRKKEEEVRLIKSRYIDLLERGRGYGLADLATNHYGDYSVMRPVGINVRQVSQSLDFSSSS